MGKTPLLNLNSVEPDRETISVASDQYPNGKLYELRTQDELTPEQLIRMQRLGEKAQEIQQLDGLGEQDLVLLDEFLNEFLDIAIVRGYQEDLKDSLSLVQKAEVVRVFSEACLGIDLATAMAEAQVASQAKAKKAKKSTGGRQ